VRAREVIIVNMDLSNVQDGTGPFMVRRMKEMRMVFETVKNF
jgi:homoaconitase/3-isopropylmalate dehydratase large subunit